MVEIKGQWYIFYHRQTNKQKCARQGCAEPITILPDGSIPQVEVTSCGLNGGPLVGKGRYEARVACNLSSAKGTFAYRKSHEKDKKQEHPFFTQSGEDRNDNSDQYIANLKGGSWCAFKYFAFDGTEKQISVSGRGNGSFLVSTDKEGKALVASVPMNSSAPFRIAAGVYAMFFHYQGSDAADFISFEIR